MGGQQCNQSTVKGYLKVVYLKIRKHRLFVIFDGDYTLLKALHLFRNRRQIDYKCSSLLD